MAIFFKQRTLTFVCEVAQEAASPLCAQMLKCEQAGEGGYYLCSPCSATRDQLGPLRVTEPCYGPWLAEDLSVQNKEKGALCLGQQTLTEDARSLGTSSALRNARPGGRPAFAGRHCGLRYHASFFPAQLSDRHTLSGLAGALQLGLCLWHLQQPGPTDSCCVLFAPSLSSPSETFRPSVSRTEPRGFQALASVG